MIHEYYSKNRNVLIEFQYEKLEGSYYQPPHTDILITSVTRSGIDVADLIPEYELSQEIRENLNDIIA